jgi:hypothetical protein
MEFIGSPIDIDMETMKGNNFTRRRSQKECKTPKMIS